MKRNVLQGRWILSRDWLPKDVIRQAYKEAENLPGSDLCAVLLAKGQLSFEQVQQTRNTSAYAMAAHINALSDQAVSKFLSESSSGDESDVAAPLPFNRDGLETRELASFIKTMKMIREGPSSNVTQSQSQVPPPSRPALPRRLPEPGETFNQYEILEKISQGSAGAVFRARHCWNKKVVALKFLNSTDPGEVEIYRFHRESTILG